MCEAYWLLSMSEFQEGDNIEPLRKYIICECFCKDCGTNHVCFRPEKFSPEDYQREKILWCCVKKTVAKRKK